MANFNRCYKKFQALLISSNWKFALFMSFMVTAVFTENSRINNAKLAQMKDLEVTKFCDQFDNFRCENGGTWNHSEESGFTCTCTEHYVGEHCQKAKPVSVMSYISSLFQRRISDVNKGGPTMWWSVFPFTSGIQLETVYAFHQSLLNRLENVNSGVGNDKHASRLLPRARPLLCPIDKTLPSLKTLYTNIFERKPGQYRPDPKDRNLLFNAFYQYFVLQFFDSNSNLEVTASQLYGTDVESERSLRSFSGGKLKTLYNNNEHYATHNMLSILRSNVYLKEFVEPTMKYVSTDKSWFSRMMLYAVSTLWVREHNRVCDILQSRMSPEGTDEQIYSMARKIVTGQMMAIMMNDILNVNTGHAFPMTLRPEVYHHRLQNISVSATPIELVLMMAVTSLPELIKKNSIGLKFFDHKSQVLESGLKGTIKFMVSQKIGMVTAHNDGAMTKPLTQILMKMSREHSLQGFNSYRRRFGMPTYNSFYELTQDRQTASLLKYLYKTIDNVEFLTGMFVEGTTNGALPTATVMANSLIVNSILTNKLTSKYSWKPDTFGGDDFFDLIKSANLESFVCRNLDENCDRLRVGLYAE